MDKKLLEILTKYNYNEYLEYNNQEDKEQPDDNRDWIDYYKQRTPLGDGNYTKKRMRGAE